MNYGKRDVLNDLVKRAVKNAWLRPRIEPLPTWGCVTQVFGCDRTTAVELCERYGVDPHRYNEATAVPNDDVAGLLE